MFVSINKKNDSGEPLNHQLNAQWGFTPAAVAPTMRYPPDRCSVITAQGRGGMGGQAHFPSFIVLAGR